jgi:hypothetical protein
VENLINPVVKLRVGKPTSKVRDHGKSVKQRLLAHSFSDDYRRGWGAGYGKGRHDGFAEGILSARKMIAGATKEQILNLLTEIRSGPKNDSCYTNSKDK